VIENIALLQIITGSIADSTECRHLSYLEGNFEVFRPSGATHCTDGVKFGMKESFLKRFCACCRICSGLAMLTVS